MHMQKTDPEPRTDFDAVIVGAGFAGICMLHRVRGVTTGASFPSWPGCVPTIVAGSETISSLVLQWPLSSSRRISVTRA